MAFYSKDKDLIDNIDINYIINFYKNKGENCIRILHGRYFDNSSSKGYKLDSSLIIEPVKNKDSYTYQDGHRVFMIDRERGSICVNPYSDKDGNSISKEFLDYCINYKQVLRDKKLKKIINEI